MKVTYKVRYMIDRFRCIDYQRTVYLVRSWRSGGLLYGYVNRFQTVSIPIDMIISIEEA